MLFYETQAPYVLVNGYKTRRLVTDLRIWRNSSGTMRQRSTISLMEALAVKTPQVTL